MARLGHNNLKINRNYVGHMASIGSGVRRACGMRGSPSSPPPPRGILMVAVGGIAIPSVPWGIPVRSIPSISVGHPSLWGEDGGRCNTGFPR